MKQIIAKGSRLVFKGLLLFISVSIFTVILYRFVNPPITSLMFLRSFEEGGKYDNKEFKKKWVKLSDISPNMVLAVVAAEDNKFTEHFGVDWEAIKKAKQLNKYSKIKHGASTITQQTAKNVFLFPSRTYFRKGLELYFTYLIEIFWSKERIMEVYLNVVEWGRKIYGVEAASQYYFHKSASSLSRNEAALLAAALPSPLKRNPSRPNSYMRYYHGRILWLMSKIETVKF